ncbi:hypothetical protein SAMN05444397_109153 [Flavobacterium aquidurense]|uniref:Uncharacterized protein n=1 Tax=Flavobacterium frigidimaris TaxID=262320 RepID=A0ABX4BPD3_FLAFR|nr:hypothetical protein [Flavobacterium frigidimaris]OXA78648.1 hypothetical protein B0A65_13020 [Flavobacterium frigidimaris]SDZ57965.1 hypothetical protein SAMN05444397_109153 [Flavobacterium aquidurense]
MITKNDVAKVFDTVLSTPGMSETVKIDLKISRKNVLLLSHIIKMSLGSKKEDSMLLESISIDSEQDLKSISEECLIKAGLVELNEKLLNLSESVKQ